MENRLGSFRRKRSSQGLPCLLVGKEDSRSNCLLLEGGLLQAVGKGKQKASSRRPALGKEERPLEQ